MQLLNRTEPSFVSTLVRKTRLLVQKSIPLDEKVELLEAAASDQSKRVEALQRLAAREQVSRQRRERLHRAIELRAKAVSHLRATAKYLVHKAKTPHTLRQAPRLFATPTWHHRPESVNRPGDEYPSMEFSS